MHTNREQRKARQRTPSSPLLFHQASVHGRTGVVNGDSFQWQQARTRSTRPKLPFQYNNLLALSLYKSEGVRYVSCLLWLGCVCYLWQQQGLIAKQHRWDICFTAALHYGWKGDAVIGRKSAFEKIVPVERQAPACLLLLSWHTAVLSRETTILC
ncbi:predicted protein [Lichtheimia corymbifera JMRC:FSU:9682]|uniref:Uncharacterized protein n=1 Tax=Lichtheimia corymbifera JMRC:FSU:9682 TaxID=1263082 RepID=A0A068RN40_9FUNG|nr:predicted protein [Lichtheimia corymbifera JMRC:FSU:9682]